MRDLSYRVVRWFGGLWEALGWLLFGAVILETLTGTAYEISIVALLTGLLLVLWWLLDGVTQELEWWQIAIGSLLVASGLVIPFRGFILLLICWVFYFFRLRSEENVV